MASLLIVALSPFTVANACLLRKLDSVILYNIIPTFHWCNKTFLFQSKQSKSSWSRHASVGRKELSWCVRLRGIWKIQLGSPLCPARTEINFLPVGGVLSYEGLVQSDVAETPTDPCCCTAVVYVQTSEPIHTPKCSYNTAHTCLTFYDTTSHCLVVEAGYKITVSIFFFFF